MKIIKFEQNVMMKLFHMYLARYADMEKVDTYFNEAAPVMEQMIEEAGEGKWLLGTDELTLLDIQCGAILDFMYTALKAPTNSEAQARANLSVTAPKWMAYQERLRAHPKIAPVCMNQEAMDRHMARTRTWEPADVKCQLSLAPLMGLFEGC